MTDLYELGSSLFGRRRAEEENVLNDATTHTYVGTAVTDSEDGSVYVALSDDVTMPDEYDGEYGVGVEMPTSVAVSEGDEVMVTVFGGGTMKAPVVTSNPGWGDAIEGRVASATEVADAAQAVAEAVNQHFFADTNGIHVTEATQEDWDANHTGANVLINSIGQLFRDGLNNLLTLTTENGARALTIWDGLGNAASNIVARFGSTIQFGSDTDPLMHIAAGIITMYPGDDYEAINFASDGTANVHYNVITGNVGIHSPQTITMTPANGSNGFSTAAGTVLWSSGGWAMAANQTANLAYKVSTCPTGIVLHWQPYTSSTVRNYYHHWQFVPKEQVASYAGTTVDVTLSSSKFASIATKTLYVSDNRVTGHADNAATGTANGITYTNNQWVLTQIIAV